jgi:hypothetical protein
MPSYEEKMEADALAKQDEERKGKENKKAGPRSKWDALGGAAKVRYSVWFSRRLVLKK